MISKISLSANYGSVKIGVSAERVSESLAKFIALLLFIAYLLWLLSILIHTL
jgi:sensor histidine kinase regulating citrate/malate metabolism